MTEEMQQDGDCQRCGGKGCIACDAREQEPVAWRFKTATFWNREPHWRYVLSLEGTEGLQGLESLYTHPQPKREWVGLTDEELRQIIGVSTSDSDWNVVKVQDWLRKVEAKLKEKNT